MNAKPQSRSRGLGELILIVVCALVMAFVIQAFLVKPYKIPTGSMVPTLMEKQRVLVNRLGNSFGDPQVGDVTVFHPPSGAEDGPRECGTEPKEGQPCPLPAPGAAKATFIKRIVAGPGDRLAVEDGHVILNGRRRSEPFVAPCGAGEGCDLPVAVTIPRGHYFMMGDNRGSSHDSRFWGPVPRGSIIGNAFATYWPPKRIGVL